MKEYLDADKNALTWSYEDGQSSPPLGPFVTSNSLMDLCKNSKHDFLSMVINKLKALISFLSYASVVQWMTVCLVLLLALVFHWETIQTDYTNAFTQVTLAEEVYMELPHDFSPPDKSAEFVLKLNKSLYGLCQAPFSLFAHLKGHLETQRISSKSN